MLPGDRVYLHRFHAGNVGDVWKHLALQVVLRALPPADPPRLLLDTHAGAGSYPLGPTGEWTEGIGRLWAIQGPTPPAIAAYLAWSMIAGPAAYPGSPRLLSAERRAGDRLIVNEPMDAPREELRALLSSQRDLEITAEDGWSLLERLPEADFALIDPPYADRREWVDAAEAVIGASRAAPSLRLLLWYPIKSYARPNRLIEELAHAGVPATAIELITSPLTSKKNRLNGSGVLLVRPPPGVTEQLAAAAAWLGPALAISGGWWTSRMVGWDENFRR